MRHDRGTQPLTDLNLRVLRMVAHGDGYKEIAVMLHLSVDGVAYHVTRCRSELGAKNRSHLIALAASRGLLAASRRLQDAPLEDTE